MPRTPVSLFSPCSLTCLSAFVFCANSEALTPHVITLHFMARFEQRGNDGRNWAFVDGRGTQFSKAQDLEETTPAPGPPCLGLALPSSLGVVGSPTAFCARLPPNQGKTSEGLANTHPRQTDLSVSKHQLVTEHTELDFHCHLKAGVVGSHLLVRSDQEEEGEWGGGSPKVLI